MSGTKQTAIIAGSVVGGVAGGYILLKIGKMAWERYMEVTYNMVHVGQVHVGQSIYSYNPHNSYNPHKFNNVIPVQLNSTGRLNNAEVANAEVALPRNISKIRGSSQKSKKHKRRTRRRTRRHHQK